MSMVTSIASAGMAMSSARALTDVNIALMGKVLDTTKSQGQAIQKMLQTAPPESPKLDVYA